MTTASVGFQCPECLRAAPATRSLRSLRSDPVVTFTLIALNVAAFLPSLTGGGGLSGAANPLTADFALNGAAVADGEWWRLVTSGFLHYGFLHLGFNMFLAFQLGSLLEPVLGRVRFALVYLVALLAGSVGALALQPGANTAGASGAVFGLLGAGLLVLRRRGVDPRQSGLVGLLGVNLVLTFVIPGISVGGHLGGLAGGAVAVSVLLATEGQSSGPRVGGVVVCAALVLMVGALGVWVANNPFGG